MQRFIFTLCLLLFLPPLCFAQLKLSPCQAIERTLERNHLLASSAHEVTAAENEVAAARSQYLPRLFLHEVASISNSPTSVFMMKLEQGRFGADDFKIGKLNSPGPYHDFKTGLTIQQPLFDGVLSKSVSLAEASAEGLKLTDRQKRQDISFQVYASWLEVRRAEAYLYNAEKAMDEAREHLRLAGVRVAVGTGLKSEDLRARTFLLETEQQLVTAKNDVLLARMKLSLLIGGSPGEETEIEDLVVEGTISSSLTDLQKRAVEHRSDLKAVRKDAEKASAATGLARAAYLPTLYATAGYQLNDSHLPFGMQNDSWQAGLTLKWELFSGMRTGFEVEKARAMERAVQEYQTEYTNTIAFEVKESFLRYEEAAKRLELATQAVLDAEESVRLISKRYQNSLATMVELLDAQTALNKVRAAQVETENGKTLAVARVWQAAGVFLEEVCK